jgi:hypothetical protein
MKNGSDQTIDEQEVNCILMDITQYKKNEGGSSWDRTQGFLVGMPAIDFVIFLSLIILTESFIVGFLYPDAGINQMWQLIFIMFFLIFLVVMLLSTVISVCKKFFKNSSYFLQREARYVAAQGRFINNLMKYGVNSLSYVATMLAYDAERDCKKDHLLFSSLHKKGGLLLRILVFIFIFYGIWHSPGKWLWIEWCVFFIGAMYITISFFALITSDEIPEAKKYVFLLGQALLLKEKSHNSSGGKEVSGRSQ